MEILVAYENPFLRDFAVIFDKILTKKGFDPAKLELIIFDEERRTEDSLKKNDVLEVLYQLGENLNTLTIYTQEPQFFLNFTRQYSEESGLITIFEPKRKQKKAFVKKSLGKQKIILDFERKGFYYGVGNYIECAYIPIYKRPWQRCENLDIMIPFGYNIVIVKSKTTNDRQYIRDRFYEGFYRNE